MGGKVGKAGRSYLCQESPHAHLDGFPGEGTPRCVGREKTQRELLRGKGGRAFSFIYPSYGMRNLWNLSGAHVGAVPTVVLGICLMLPLCPCTFSRSLPCPQGDPCGLPLARLLSGCLQRSELSPFFSGPGRTVPTTCWLGDVLRRGSPSPALSHASLVLLAGMQEQAGAQGCAGALKVGMLG